MKFKKIYLVSILLLAILTLGAASAAENVTADLAVEDAGDLEVPASDEITTDGDDSKDVGTGDANNKILGTSHEEKLSNTTTITVDAPTIYNGQEATVTANVGQATGNINFTLGNDTQKIRIVNGSATYKTNDYQIGENTVTIVYDGDGTFEPATTTATFAVLEKENATILASVYKTADKNMVVICIPGATGNVNVVINGKKEVLTLKNGIATYNINASDVITEINVTYGGDFRFNPVNTTNFAILENNVVNNETYIYYFNQAEYGKLFSFIESGTTLDFQGSIINPDKSNSAYMDVSIPVNIVSTTGDAYVELNSGDAWIIVNELRQNSFVISNGGSGSNITGINFFNTQVWIYNTSYVVLDKINVVSNSTMGSGTGIFSIRVNSFNVTLKNSYSTRLGKSALGAATTATLAGAINCTLYNNTITNIMLLNPYSNNLDNFDMNNSYNRFINNNIGMLQYSGRFNLIENNTIDTLAKGGIAGGSNNTVVGNNVSTISAGTIDSIYYNNNVSKNMVVSQGSEAYNNIAGGLALTGANALVHDNIINGATTINLATNTQIFNNTFIGDYTIKFNNANAKNITFANNYVIGNIEFGNKNAKNNKIVNNTITTSKDYAINLKTYTGTETNITGNILNSAKGFGNNAVNHANDPTLILDNYQTVNATIGVLVSDIKVGGTAVINIASNETSMTGVDVIVNNNERYSVSLVNGKGLLELPNLLSGEYNVSAISNDLTYGGQNTASFNVSKNNLSILVDAPAKTQWIDSNITVTIADATGNVTLDINDTEFISDLIDGVAVFAVPDLAYGTYAFNVTYAGDYKYFGNITNGNLTVNRNKEVKIIASDIVEYKLVDKFVAKFVNYIGEGIANANVTFTIGDAVYPVITDENGTAIVDLALTRGKYDVNVKFIVIEDEYDAASAEYNMTVIDASTIKIVSVDEKGLITGLLYDALGAPIANAVVATSMNGTEVNLTTNDAGLFEFQAEDGCEVTFVFAGDDITTGSDASITVSIKPTPKNTSIINIVVVDGTGLITGSLIVLGNPVTSAIVVATMNGTSVNLVTDEAGLFQFLAQNGLEVTFKYAGDINTTDANATITLNNIVPVPKDTSIIKVVSVDGTGLITGSLTVLGNPIVNAAIVASMNGVDTNLTTDANGLFKFQAQNGFETNFKYAGNDTVTSSDVAITLSNMGPVPKDTSIIKIVSVDGDGLVVGSLTVLGNPITNATVVAGVNESDVNLTTDDNGSFMFQAQNGLEAVFKYAGTDAVTSSDASITLINVANIVKDTKINVSSVKRAAVDTGAGEKGKAYIFTLKDVDGNALADKTAKVTLNGKVYTVKTNENGKASVTIALSNSKKYNLNVFFMGDNDYKGSTATAKITVTKKKTALKVAKTKYIFKAKAKSKVIKATLKTSNKFLKAGKKVTIKIKGKTYVAKTGKNGAIKLNIKALNKKGTYKAKIKFAGDSTYKASGSKTIKIVIK